MIQNNHHFTKPDIGVHTDCFWREKGKYLEIWMSADAREIGRRLASGQLPLGALLREIDESHVMEVEHEGNTA